MPPRGRPDSRRHARASGLPQALHDYAALAGAIGGRIVEADADFDVALVDEAHRLAKQLGGLVTPEPSGRAGHVAQAARVRNQLLYLLAEQVGLVRRTAAHVFRNAPEVVREVTSAYDRRRRAAQRRAKKQKADTPPPPATNGTSPTETGPPA